MKERAGLTGLVAAVMALGLLLSACFNFGDHTKITPDKEIVLQELSLEKPGTLRPECYVRGERGEQRTGELLVLPGGEVNLECTGRWGHATLTGSVQIRGIPPTLWQIRRLDDDRIVKDGSTSQPFQLPFDNYRVIMRFQAPGRGPLERFTALEVFRIGIQESRFEATMWSESLRCTEARVRYQEIHGELRDAFQRKKGAEATVALMRTAKLSYQDGHCDEVAAQVENAGREIPR
jgi:hypothetical protein